MAWWEDFANWWACLFTVSNVIMYTETIKLNIDSNLRGRVKFPTGGDRHYSLKSANHLAVCQMVDLVQFRDRQLQSGWEKMSSLILVYYIYLYLSMKFYPKALSSFRVFMFNHGYQSSDPSSRVRNRSKMKEEWSCKKVRDHQNCQSLSFLHYLGRFH